MKTAVEKGVFYVARERVPDLLRAEPRPYTSSVIYKDIASVEQLVLVKLKERLVPSDAATEVENWICLDS